VQALAVERLGVAQADLAEFLGRQRGLGGLRATMEPCWIGVHWSLPGPDLRARLGVDAGPAPMPFSLRADGVRYGGVRLPSLMVGWVVRNFDPTPRLRLPITVPVVPISIEAGRLDVGSDPGPRCPTKESH